MSDYQVEIQNETYPVDEERLRQTAEAVLKAHAAPGEMTIVITDNEAVADLNRQFRDTDAPTDVLSFLADADMPGDARYWGDLIIAYPYALAQAEREGHSPDDSFCLLVVHGTLHLLGYDHDTPENRAKMWAMQEQMLQQLNVPVSIVPALESSDHD